MNDILSLDELKSLLAVRQGPCVSIFMPTHGAAPDNRADPLQLKSLLQEAHAALETGGIGSSAADVILAPASRLVDAGLFWRPRPGGLALYLADGAMRMFRTAAALTPSVYVNDHFHVRPILADVDRGEHYFVLALSQHSVRVFRGDRDGLNELDLGDMPRDIAEALRNDGYDTQVQMHSSGAAPTGGGRGAAMFHGSGSGTDTGINTRYLAEFVKRVAARLADVVPDRHAPFVLAMVGELAVMYREADRTHAIASDIVPGNPEPLTLSELHARSWTIASAEYDGTRRQVIARYHETAGTAHAAQAPQDVVTAAAHGRVDTLLINPAATLWGAFSPADAKVEVHAEPQAGDDDLLDLAAGQTILNGGAVYTAEDLEEPLAAILRY